MVTATVSPGVFGYAGLEAAMTFSRRGSLRALAAATISQSWPAVGAKPSLREAGIRLVVLDVGGTIIEDRGDVPEVLRSVLAGHGIAASPAEIGQLRGASKREIVRHFVDRQSPAEADREKLAGAIYQEFRDQLMAAYRKVPAIAGAEEAFETLRQRGYLLATTTGFDREITTSIFRRLGWEKYFAATICSDDVVQGRPAPFMLFHAMESARVSKVSETMAVGDTPLDLQAGSNGGLRGVVGVLSGASTAEMLRRETHTHILPSVAQLPGLLAARS
jgi:phosphonatase-like hydrolase